MRIFLAGISREICMFFRIPRKMSKEIGKTAKTCWNILEKMIERFLRILNPTKIILQHLNRGHLWKEEYYETVIDMFN
jgi:hypothetical protein